MLFEFFPGEKQLQTVKLYSMEDNTIAEKKTSSVSTHNSGFAFFDELPDDLAAAVISKVGATATCRADFFNLLFVCKRLKALGFSPTVISQLSPKAFLCKSQNWCDGAHSFLKSCADAHNLQAIYTLAMIHFYCLGLRDSGISLLHKSAARKHPSSLYSLSVIVFNQSLGTTNDPLYEKIGLLYALRAAILGHVDAICEFGHCLREGSGTEKDEAFAAKVIRLAKELASRKKITLLPPLSTMDEFKTLVSNYPDLPSVLNLNELHPANRFLIEWYDVRGGELAVGLRICCWEGCGRTETRYREFRRCTDCENVSYCSRACQDYDCKSHSENCYDIQI